MTQESTRSEAESSAKVASAKTTKSAKSTKPKSAPVAKTTKTEKMGVQLALPVDDATKPVAESKTEDLKSDVETKVETSKPDAKTRADEVPKPAVEPKIETAKSPAEPKNEVAEPKAEIPSTREARIAGGEAGRRQKEIYKKWKAFAFEREKTNYSKLFLIHEKNNWWKMIGHSAVFFHYDVAKRIRMASRLVPDSDYDFKSEEGVINIRDIYALDAKLTVAGISPLALEGPYRVYNIGKKYTRADIVAMKNEKAMEWARINKIILPKEVFPTLYTALRELTKRLYFATKTFDGYAREVVGKPMFEKGAGLLREYSLLANKAGLSDSDFLSEAERTIDWITSQMTIVSELRLLSTERIYQILQATEKVRRGITQCNPKKI